MDTVGRNRKVIEEHIRNQVQEDIANDLMKKLYDPFTSEKYLIAKNKAALAAA